MTVKTITMTVDELLTYVSLYNGKQWKSIPDDPYSQLRQEYISTDRKVHNLIKKFGFELVYCKFDTMQYKLTLDNEEYASIYITYVETKLNGGKTDIYVRVIAERVTPTINPATGQPWQTTDTEQVAQGYSRHLTKDGWWTGD